MCHSYSWNYLFEKTCNKMTRSPIGYKDPTSSFKIWTQNSGMSAGRMGWMAHRKWIESKQQSSMLPGPAVPGCCLISFHFLWDIHPIRPALHLNGYNLQACGVTRSKVWEQIWPCFGSFESASEILGHCRLSGRGQGRWLSSGMHRVCESVLRSVDLWERKCVESRAFLLRRRAVSPSPSGASHAPPCP